MFCDGKPRSNVGVLKRKILRQKFWIRCLPPSVEGRSPLSTLPLGWVTMGLRKKTEPRSCVSPTSLVPQGLPGSRQDRGRPEGKTDRGLLDWARGVKWNSMCVTQGQWTSISQDGLEKRSEKGGGGTADLRNESLCPIFESIPLKEKEKKFNLYP